jgi:hypothetical protein
VALKLSLAHVRRNEDGSFAIHELEEHVRAVGGMAQCEIATRPSKAPPKGFRSHEPQPGCAANDPRCDGKGPQNMCESGIRRRKG